MCFKKKEKDPEKICRFCMNAKLTNNEDLVLCTKRGIVKADHVCKKYVYDLLKRNPGKQIKVSNLEYVDLND